MPDKLFSTLMPQQSRRRAVIIQAYEAFNRRDIDAVLSLMSTDVHWPNGWEGGYVQGHEAVRDYWTRQWKELNPIVKPMAFEEKEDGQIVVTVHQVVKDLEEQTLFDGMVLHTYAFNADGDIKRHGNQQSLMVIISTIITCHSTNCFTNKKKKQCSRYSK